MEDILKTALKTDIPITTRGILYGCRLDRVNSKLIVIGELFFEKSFDALTAYTEIPNPESQLATGESFDELIQNLQALHKRMSNPEWVDGMAETV